jgi:hypothetical protein
MVVVLQPLSDPLSLFPSNHLQQWIWNSWLSQTFHHHHHQWMQPDAEINALKI